MSRSGAPPRSLVVSACRSSGRHHAERELEATDAGDGGERLVDLLLERLAQGAAGDRQHDRERDDPVGARDVAHHVELGDRPLELRVDDLVERAQDGVAVGLHHTNEGSRSAHFPEAERLPRSRDAGLDRFTDLETHSRVLRIDDVSMVVGPRHGAVAPTHTYVSPRHPGGGGHPGSRMLACDSAAGSSGCVLRPLGVLVRRRVEHQRTLRRRRPDLAARRPNVLHGHVAAWVGVGGAGLGPGSTDEWLQVGISARPERGSRALLRGRAAEPGAALRDAEGPSADRQDLRRLRARGAEPAGHLAGLGQRLADDGAGLSARQSRRLAADRDRRELDRRRRSARATRSRSASSTSRLRRSRAATGSRSTAACWPTPATACSTSSAARCSPPAAEKRRRPGLWPGRRQHRSGFVR